MSYRVPESAEEWLQLPEVLLPVVSSTASDGTVYEVRKVGFLGVPRASCPSELHGAQHIADKVLLPTVTAVVDGSDLLCRLPLDLSPWARHSVEAAHAGMNPFPARVEFGRLAGRAYAEVL